MFFITPLGTATVLCSFMGDAELLGPLVSRPPEQDHPHRQSPPARAGGGARRRSSVRALRALSMAWSTVQPLIASGALTKALGAPRRRPDGSG